MTAVLFWILGIGLAKLIRPKRPKHESKPLCTDCAFAHVQLAANGRRAISCTIGAGVRPVTIDVLYCGDFCNRNAPPRVVAIGFAAERTPLTEVAEIAQARPSPVATDRGYFAPFDRKVSGGRNASTASPIPRRSLIRRHQLATNS